MSDGTKVNDTPTPDAVVLVWGGRCQQCGLTYPGDGEDPVIRAHVKSEWVKAGLGHLVQDEWPRRFPAWLVRQGFRCPVCEAPDMLIDLGTVEGLRVREFPEVGR
ncbi:MAG TPA: hypothetical protein PKD75_14350 [Tepidiformaceae bacterium]|nr:hypothetical protein [Tepidiformaceae bacterium]